MNFVGQINVQNRISCRLGGVVGPFPPTEVNRVVYVLRTVAFRPGSTQTRSIHAAAVFPLLHNLGMHRNVVISRFCDATRGRRRTAPVLFERPASAASSLLIYFASLPRREVGKAPTCATRGSIGIAGPQVIM